MREVKMMAAVVSLQPRIASIFNVNYGISRRHAKCPQTHMPLRLAARQPKAPLVLPDDAMRE